MTGECDAKSTCRAVADAFSNFCDASFFASQQILCQSHAPTQSRMEGSIPDAHGLLAQSVFAEWGQSSAVTRALDVAGAVWQAANEPSSPLRIAAAPMQLR